ncbi:MAG: hypothetical protein AB8F26_07005 [Phycisphaerales bacterium]
MKAVLLTAISVMLASTLIGCDRSAPVASGDPITAPAQTESQAPNWLLTELPTDAQSVGALKTAAREGDIVTVRGRIGGSRSPMTADSAVFTIVDSSLPTCADNPDDNCRTPWDYCCEPREVLTANSATIQLVDAEGNPLTIDATTHLNPGDEIVVAGKVAPRPHSSVLIVQATVVHVVGG